MYVNNGNQFKCFSIHRVLYFITQLQIELLELAYSQPIEKFRMEVESEKSLNRNLLQCFFLI